MTASEVLYIFLDEGGNFDFSQKGSCYFTLTSVATTSPTCWDAELAELKHSLLVQGENIERFHATEDLQATRDRVFSIIQNHLHQIRVDALIVEKCKAGPALRDVVDFYPRMLGYLLRYVLKGDPGPYSEIIVMTDRIPVNKRRNAVEKAVKATLKSILPASTPYHLFHHASMSSYALQVADYCNWAIGIKWERNEMRSYVLVQSAIRSEFDIFRTGTRRYY